MVIGSAVLALALAAAPEGDALLVLPVTVEGRDTASFVQSVDAAIERGLGRGAYRVVKPAQDDACRDRSCAASAARRVDAGYALLPKLTAADRNYDLSLVVVDADSGRAVVEATESCDLCGMEEVAEMIEAQAAAIRTRLDALAASPPVVAFESTPPAALIELDGAPIGPTPVEREIEPGAHRARATLEGYVTAERSFEAVGGVREVFRFDLEPQPESPGTSRRRMRIAAWSLLGVGIASTAVGGALIGIDHDPVRSRCSGGNVDPAGNCKFIFLTRGAGIGLVAAGGAMLITSVALFIASRRSRR